ncbi:CLOCK-interacting pacemaker a [Gouania willdenowi]|uniref:CLOCK-interacting pacemaker a n=1 Tax=Gouania willdenowi TaxID=441366 RepID=A0A8C5G8G9_GOUWI|nr:CLOCK-interacting pacemaker [Gouania willdenowi]
MSSFSRPDKHGTSPFARALHHGISKQELERDSGFSDASSEYLSAIELTDSEDVGTNGKMFRQGQESAQAPVAVMGGSFPGLSPMFIMNNFVLKQPPSMGPAEKQWAFSSPLEMMPQSQVVLLQPMVPSSDSSSPKTGSEDMQQSKSYMPILKSYPRIAPHPVDTPTTRAGPQREKSCYNNQRQRRHRHRLHSVSKSLPAPQATADNISSFEATPDPVQAAESSEQLLEGSLSSLTGSSSASSLEADFMTEIDDDQGTDSTHNNKLKRFSNTYNILSNSGLLEITMRTKQLIKENKHTQGQLQQLQEQTALLLKALSSGDPQLWTKLQLSLQDTDIQQWGSRAQSVLQ